MVRALGEVIDTTRDRVLVDRRQLAGRHRRDRRPARGRAAVGRRAAPARQGGLGPAYLAGFGRALAAGAELVLEIDCDFSHDPKDVPRLIAACEDGADVALGSR